MDFIDGVIDNIQCKKDKDLFIFKRKQLKKTIDDLYKRASIETSGTSIYLFLAWLLDEEIIDGDPEKLVENYKHLETWFSAVDDNLLKVRNVKKIIEDRTGMNIFLTHGNTRIVKGEEDDRNKN